MRYTNAEYALIWSVAVTVILCVGTVAYLRRPMRGILMNRCPSEDRAAFWLAFSNIVVILLPMICLLTAYVGGGLESAAVDDDAWVVAAVDGVVSGVSPLFAEERHPRGFHLLLDADRVGPRGTDLELYVVEEPGGPLRPIGARPE